MDDILELVKSSLSEPVPQPQTFDSFKANGVEIEDVFPDADADADGDVDMEEQFDDTGEGAGIEGDLDVEED